MQPERQVAGVGGEVKVCRVDSRAATERHAAEQEVDRRAGHACCAADVSRPGGFLEILECKGYVGKGAQRREQPFEGVSVAAAGQQLLPYWANQKHAMLLHQLGPLRDVQAFVP